MFLMHLNIKYFVNFQKLAEEASVCRRKMSRASMLITELTGEYKRWTDESKQLKEQIKR